MGIADSAGRFAHRASKSQSLKAEAMLQDVLAAVYKYSEEVPLALALGVLDIAKDEIKSDE